MGGGALTMPSQPQQNSSGAFPRFSVVADARGAEFAAFWEIFENSFPYEEQRERRDWDSALRDPACRVRLYGNAENARAILAFWHFGGCRYVEYFAIAPAERGNGLGGEILRRFVAEEPGVPVILEIEPPESSAVAARRLRFYERLGFVRNAREHFHPPYHAEFGRQRLVILNTGPAPLAPEARERFVRDLETRAMGLREDDVGGGNGGDGNAPGR